jgi:UDP:flavonoid glycosyltransferase YjiC (YdhE family)
LCVQVLFIVFPGEGHVRPLLPLALAAKEAGHEVIFATGGDGVPVAEASGLATMEVGMPLAKWRSESARRFGDQPGADSAGRIISGGREGWRRAIRAFALVYAPTMVDDIMKVIAGWTPDLVVYDPAALAGAVVGRILRVPCVIHGYGVLRPVEALDAFDVAAGPLWEQYGVTAPKWAGLSDDIYFDPIPPSLQAPHAALVPRVHKIRTVERPAPGPQPDTPSVYVTFGTIFADQGLFRTVLSGISGIGVDVIATVGRRIDPDDLGPQPDHVRIDRFIPQAEILSRVSVAVCHAGSGTLLGALAAGVPLVMVPQGADHFWNAEACSRAGAGTMVESAEVSPESIGGAVRSVLEDHSCAQRAGDLANEIAAMPSPRDCLGFLEVHRAG